MRVLLDEALSLLESQEREKYRFIRYSRRWSTPTEIANKLAGIKKGAITKEKRKLEENDDSETEWFNEVIIWNRAKGQEIIHQIPSATVEILNAYFDRSREFTQAQIKTIKEILNRIEGYLK